MIGGTKPSAAPQHVFFIDRGHSVKSVALPPLPEGAPIPEEMEIVMCNIYEKTDDEIRGMRTAVFAAGVDESRIPRTRLRCLSTTSLRSRLLPICKRSSVTRRPLSSALTSPTLPKSVRI